MDEHPHIAFLFESWPAPPPSLCDAEMEALAAAGFRLTIASLAIPDGCFRLARPASLAAEVVYPPAAPLFAAIADAAPQDSSHREMAALSAAHLRRYPGSLIPPETEGMARWLARELRRRSVQHIHARSPGALPAALYLKKAGLPFSFTAPAPGGFSSPGLLAEVVTEAEFVIAPTAGIQSQLADLCPEHAARIIHIPPGLDASRYYGALCGESGTLRLITSGSPAGDRGLLLLLESMARLAREGIDTTLTIAGDGPWRGQLENLITKLQLNRCVRFSASDSDPEETRRELAASDLYVHPGTEDNDTLPPGIMEAMATGLPVLAAAHSGTEDLVIDGFSGWLFPAGDGETLAARLIEAAENPVLRSAMGQRGLERIQTAFPLGGHARLAASQFRRSIAGRFAPAVSTGLPEVLCLLEQWPLPDSDPLLAAELEFLCAQPGVALLTASFDGSADRPLPPDNLEFLPDAAIMESIWQQEPELAARAAALRTACPETNGEDYFREARRAVYTVVLCRTRGWVHVHAMRASTALWAWIFQRLAGITASAVIERQHRQSSAALREIAGGFRFGSVSDPQIGGPLPDLFPDRVLPARRRLMGMLPPGPPPIPPLPDAAGIWRQWLAQARTVPRPAAAVSPV